VSSWQDNEPAVDRFSEAMIAAARYPL